MPPTSCFPEQALLVPRLPQLLIIGAMKSGTTGVFMDLCRHPMVFLPDNKEPHALRDEKVLTSEGRAAYAALYERARPDQLLCDASTGYTKRPDYPGVVERALKVLPDGFRVIYVVRDPVARIVSHHFHEFIEGRVPADLDQVVRSDPRFINYSRYGYQLEPWVDALGVDRVRVVRFEDYTADRQATVAGLCECLELDSVLLPTLDATVHNQNQGKPVMNRFWRRFQSSSVYRYGLRPLVSLRMRAALQKMVLPKAPSRPPAPPESTLAWLREQLADDVVVISRLAGRAEPLWPGYELPGAGAGNGSA
jgi:hypothetical protein